MSWPDGLNPYLSPERRAELLAERDYRRAHGIPWPADLHEPDPTEAAAAGSPAQVIGHEGKWIRVSLTDAQKAEADPIGRERQRRSSSRRSSNRHGFRGKTYVEEEAIHLLGARGEMAAALVTGLPWNKSIDTFKAGADIGEDVQVRARSNPTWDLPVRRDDNLEHDFVLVVADGPILIVVGWIAGIDVDNPAWLKRYGDREEAHFVPQAVLLPFPIS